MKINHLLIFCCILLLGLSVIVFIKTQEIVNYTSSNKYLYEDVIKRFSQTHVYNNTAGENKYNCINYSNDLVDVLNNLGYNASVKVVNDGTHMIIQLHLDIEPQTAMIMKGGLR